MTFFARQIRLTLSALASAGSLAVAGDVVETARRGSASGDTKEATAASTGKPTPESLMDLNSLFPALSPKIPGTQGAIWRMDDCHMLMDAKLLDVIGHGVWDQLKRTKEITDLPSNPNGRKIRGEYCRNGDGGSILLFLKGSAQNSDFVEFILNKDQTRIQTINFSLKIQRDPRKITEELRDAGIIQIKSLRTLGTFARGVLA